MEIVEPFADGEGNIHLAVFPLSKRNGLAREEDLKERLSETVAHAERAEVLGRPQGAGVFGAGTAEQFLAEFRAVVSFGVVNELKGLLGKGLGGQLRIERERDVECGGEVRLGDLVFAQEARQIGVSRDGALILSVSRRREKIGQVAIETGTKALRKWR